jgi:ATP-dependent Clp protease ATP-binding subunit ClpA
MGFRSGGMPIDQIKCEVDRELERKFPPEFRNRIDGIVLFQPLTTDEVREIAVKYIASVEETLKRWGKSLVVEPEALQKLVQDGYSLAYGARFLKRVIDDRIKLPISQRWKEVNQFRAAVQADQVVIEPVGPRLVATTDPDAIAV